MNIVVNAVFMHNKPRGVGRVCNNILIKIAQKDKKNQYYIYYGKWQDYDFLNICQENFHFIKLNIPVNAFIRNFYLAFILPFKIKKYKPDVYHLMDTSPVYIKTCPTISTIHDLAEFSVPEKYNKVKCFLRKIYVKSQAKKSDLIITVSNYTKKDIQDRFNINENKIRVIHNYFENSHKIDINRKYKNYFLVVGEIERTKNVGMIVEAFSKLKLEKNIDFRLIIVGKRGNDYDNVVTTIKKYKIENYVDLLNYVPDDKLFELYKNAFALIFASSFEGFGLPLLEAMSFGIPVISSNTSSMPEVVGKAGLLFNPKHVNDLEENMLKLTQDKSLRNKMIELGYEQIKLFDYDKLIRKLLDTYGEFEKKI